MDSEKISIIVPIYNAEKKLHRCIESILNQSYKNLEIILVNDGSSDNSINICEKYKIKDNRIIIIDKENAGVSVARNSGLNIATGKYIQFVDSDDYINPDMCEKLIKTINKNNADVVVCGYNKITNGKIESKFIKETTVFEMYNFKNTFNEIFKGALFNVPWNKLYKREKINNYFKEDLSIGEDLLFNLNYFSNCNKIEIIEKCLYCYDVSQQESLTSKYNENLLEIEVMLFQEVQTFYKTCFGTDCCCDINEVFAKEVYYFLKKLVFLSNENTKSKLKKIEYCEKNEFVSDIIRHTNFEDGQIRIVCFLMKLNCKRSIYLFFKLKQIINKNGIH